MKLADLERLEAEKMRLLMAADEVIFAPHRTPRARHAAYRLTKALYPVDDAWTVVWGRPGDGSWGVRRGLIIGGYDG